MTPRTLAFIACAGFAMPCYAEPLQIGQPVDVGAMVNVQSFAAIDLNLNGLYHVEGAGLCQIETKGGVIRGYCNDDEPVKMAGDDTMMIYY